MQMNDRVMTVREICKFLRVSRMWVYKNRALLGGIKIGGKVIFTEGGILNAVQDAERKMASGS